MKIKKCRICGNNKLIKIGSLGKIAISNFTLGPQEGEKYPLELVYCEKCTLLQLAHNTPRNLLYKNYWYESHINPIIVEDLRDIAQYGKGVHVDIGGNDGTLLKYSKAKVKINVDPSDIRPLFGGPDISICDYWENVKELSRIPSKNIKTADVITAIACLYDLPKPNNFMANIKKFLAPDGVFIAQLMTLQPFIDNNDVGNICHEHLEYYSYKSLVTLFEQNGLEIFKVEENNMNGGSYRLFAQHYKTGSTKFDEKEYNIKDLKNFFKRVEKNKQKTIEFLKKNSDKKIWILGASTKLGSILQYYKINNKIINGVLEINPDKVGKYTINSGIKIYDEKEVAWNKIDYVWIAPYGFSRYFISKHEKWFKKGGKFFVSIPKFTIIEYADFKNM